MHLQICMKFMTLLSCLEWWNNWGVICDKFADTVIVIIPLTLYDCYLVIVSFFLLLGMINTEIQNQELKRYYEPKPFDLFIKCIIVSYLLLLSQNWLLGRSLMIGWRKKILDPWKGAHSSHSVCVCVCVRPSVRPSVNNL